MAEPIIERWSGACSPMSLFQRMQIGLLTLLVTACGALAAATWQAVKRYCDHQSEQRQELKRFHANLVSEMRHLSENAGVLNSADLSLVRFRVRQGDDWGIPALPVSANLTAVERPDHVIPAAMSSNGILNFGLLGPARYRLAIWTQAGYRLEYDFDILPGVPVDRLVMCPLSDDLPHLATQIEMEENVSSLSPDLTVLFYVERDDVTVGDWTWSMSPRGGVWVSSSDVSGATAEQQQLALSTAVSAEVLPHAPFLNCRCTAMAIVQRQASEQNASSLLATFRFQVEADDDAEQISWPEPVYDIDAPAPRFRRPMYAELATWRIELPPAAVWEIERQLEYVAGDSQKRTGEFTTVTSGVPWLPLGSAFVPWSIISGEHLATVQRVED